MSNQNHPFPWLKTLSDILTPVRPDLSGSPLVITSDSRKKDGYVIDAVYCTNNDCLIPWMSRSKKIRSANNLNGRGLHYKDLRHGGNHWTALQPTIHSASLTKGVAIIMFYSEEVHLMNQKVISKAINSSLPRTKHRWKTGPLVEIVGMVSLLASVIGIMSHPQQRVHWISDHELLFEKEKQLADLNSFLNHSISLCCENELGLCSIETTRLPEPEDWKFDITAIPDLFAGGMGDVIVEAEGRGENISVWTPVTSEPHWQKKHYRWA